MDSFFIGGVHQTPPISGAPTMAEQVGRDLKQNVSKLGGKSNENSGDHKQDVSLGAQRHVEARIGELLGAAHPGERTDLSAMPERLVSYDDAASFRLLARALAGECVLSDDEWRKSRRALVSLVRQRLGLMPESLSLSFADRKNDHPALV